MRDVAVHPDATDLHHPAHMRRRAELDELLERLHVDGFELFRRRMHIEMHARQVEYRVDAFERVRQAAGIADVLHPKVHSGSLTTLGTLGTRRRMHVDGPDLEATTSEIGREVRAHEAGRAGDEYPLHHFRAETATA